MASLLSQEGPGSAGWPWGKSGRQRVGNPQGGQPGITRVPWLPLVKFSVLHVNLIERILSPPWKTHN